MYFFIAQTEKGYAILELPEAEKPTDLAAEIGAAVIDEGPFSTYEDASDALVRLEQEVNE